MIGRVIRTLTALVGIALVGGAAVLLFAPDAVEPLIPVGAIAESQPFSDPLVRAGIFVGIGIGAALWTAWTAPSWNAAREEAQTGREPEFPDFETLRIDPPETATATPVVGDSFDERIEAMRAAATAGRDDTVRDRLRSLAVETLVSVEGCSRETARARLTEGSWTDDPVAAAYLADREATLPFWRRLLAWLRPAWTRDRRIRRAADAIAAQVTTRSDRDLDRGGRA